MVQMKLILRRCLCFIFGCGLSFLMTACVDNASVAPSVSRSNPESVTAKSGNVFESFEPGVYESVAIARDGVISSGAYSSTINFYDSDEYINGSMAIDGFAYDIHWEKKGNNLTITRVYDVESGYVPSQGEDIFSASISNGIVVMEFFGAYYAYAAEGSDVETIKPDSIFDDEFLAQTLVYTLEEASEKSGVFVKKGDLFYPLANGMYIYGAGEVDYQYVTAAAELPRLSEGDELVYFSWMPSDAILVNKALDYGYTIPFSFSQTIYYEDTGDAYSPVDSDLSMFAHSALYHQQYGNIAQRCTDEQWKTLLEVVEDTYSGNVRIEDTETGWGIRGDFYEEEQSFEFGEYFYPEILEGESNWFLNVAPNTNVTLSYFCGTVWKEASIPACVRFWQLGMGEAQPLELEPTKSGYFTIDTSDFGRGTYVVQDLGYMSDNFESYSETALLFEVG